jgi:hypothetical protein
MIRAAILSGTLFIMGLFALAQAQSPAVRTVILQKAPAPVGGGNPTITFVASVGAPFTSGGSGVTTAARNTTTANFCIAYVASANGTTPAVSDSQSNTWTQIGTGVAINAGTATLHRYYVDPATFSGNASQTFTLGAVASSFASIAVGCFAGVINSPFDTTDTGGGTSTSPQVATGFTPAVDGEVVTAGAIIDPSSNSATAINSSFTGLLSVSASPGINYGVAFAYIIQTSKTAVQPTWTLFGLGPWNTSIESFK